MKDYPAVNWKNGMKIESDHFIQERDHIRAFSELVNQINLNPYNFGIYHSSTVPQLKIRVVDFNFQLIEILAVSKDGNIVYNGKEDELLEFSLKDYDLESKTVYQIYAYNSDADQEYGDIDEEEFPVRFPNVKKKIEIEFATKDQLDTFNNKPGRVAIGQIEIEGNSVKIIDKYIPPVNSLRAHEKLSEIHATLDEYNFELARLNNALSQKSQFANKELFTNRNIHQLSSNITLFIADKLDVFRYELIDKSPMHVFLYYKKLARLISALLAAMINQEQMITQFSQAVNIAPTEFMAAINEMNMLEYDHDNISENLKSVLNFIEFILRLFRNIDIN